MMSVKQKRRWQQRTRRNEGGFCFSLLRSKVPENVNRRSRHSVVAMATSMSMNSKMSTRAEHKTTGKSPERASWGK